MTPAEFQTAFPQFENVEVPILQRHIDDADPFFDVSRWGDKYARGFGNFVAHHLELELRKRGVAPGTSSANDATEKQVGSVRIRRSDKLVEMQAQNPFLKTEYGQIYWQLAEQVGAGMLAV